MSGSFNDSQQDSTKSLSTDVEPGYYDLEPKYQYALEARLDGVKYKVIAENLRRQSIQITEQAIRLWFMKGGPLCLIFRNMKRERAREVREMFKHLREEYADIAPEAMTTIKKHVRNGSLAAAMHVMDVNGFEPVHKIEDVTPRTVRIMVVKPDGAEVLATQETTE